MDDTYIEIPKQYTMTAGVFTGIDHGADGQTAITVWRALNRERGELIDAAVAGTIDGIGAARLKYLTAVVDAHLQSVAPRSMELLDAIDNEYLHNCCSLILWCGRKPKLKKRDHKFLNASLPADLRRAMNGSRRHRKLAREAAAAYRTFEVHNAKV